MFTYPKLPAQQYIHNIHQIPIPRPQITTHSEVSSVASHTERPTISITSTVAPLANSHHQSVAPIEYVQSVKVQPTQHQPQPIQQHRFVPTHQYHQYVQQPQQFHYPQPVNYNFDFFNNRHASSLLDSYIPSSVVLARQKGLLHHLLTTPFHFRDHLITAHTTNDHRRLQLRAKHNPKMSASTLKQTI
jgi:hypothetical protein